MFKSLIQWSKKEFSYLPWRKKRSLYGTLVSEIMLQQTTVGTVLNHFERFMQDYPTIQDLAQATEEQLLISWKGLGYYRRARNLKNAAQAIVDNYQGKIPLVYNQLVSIPGIGDYTANAILAIGEDLPTVALDANLERVFARYFGLTEIKGPKLMIKIKETVESKFMHVLKEFGGRDINESLMDLGRNYCQARKTSCDLCFLRSNCVAYHQKIVLELPKQVFKENSQTNLEIILLRVILMKDNKILSYRKNESQWLSGQYEVPTFCLATNDVKLNQYPPLKNISENFDYLPEFQTGITKYKITNKVLWLNEDEFQKIGLKIKDYEWVSLNDNNHNLSTASIKALKL